MRDGRWVSCVCFLGFVDGCSGRVELSLHVCRLLLVVLVDIGIFKDICRLLLSCERPTTGPLLGSTTHADSPSNKSVH